MIDRFFDPNRDATPENCRELLGGKACGLLTVSQLGFRTPRWICLTTETFREVMAAEGRDQSVPRAVRRSVVMPAALP